MAMANEAATVDVGQVWVWKDAFSVRYRVTGVDGLWVRLRRERDGATESTPISSLVDNWTRLTA